MKSEILTRSKLKLHSFTNDMTFLRVKSNSSSSLFLFVVISLILPLRSALSQDAAAGERSFAKCRACHQIGPSSKNGVGPQLNGLFGRATGSVAGYSYSAANKSAGFTWDDARFAAYIKNPKANMPGTKMVFAGIASDAEIGNLAAYLKQFSLDGSRKP